MTKEQKALSVNQPWAWCIVNGYKPVENRNWKTHVTGWILIHAGKKFDDYGYDWIKSEFPEIPLPPKDDIERGGIVGKAFLTGCVKDMDNPWFFGEYGFVLENQEPCELKPCKGALGFFMPDYNSRYKEPAPKKKKELPLFGGER